MLIKGGFTLSPHPSPETTIRPTASSTGTRLLFALRFKKWAVATKALGSQQLRHGSRQLRAARSVAGRVEEQLC